MSSTNRNLLFGKIFNFRQFRRIELHSLFASVKHYGGDGNSAVAYDFMFGGDGAGHVDRRNENHQSGGHGHGENRKISGIRRGYFGDGGAACVFAAGHAGIHHARENHGDYGRGRGEAQKIGEFFRGERNAAYLGAYFSGLRRDRVPRNQIVRARVLAARTRFQQSAEKKHTIRKDKKGEKQ